VRSSPKYVRASKFQFYLHDRAEWCQLQLLGQLAAEDLPELQSCCNTVRTTLDGRKLVLDVRGLNAIDSAGEQWLAEKRTEGAEIVDQVADESSKNTKALKSFFAASSAR
jgi:ABC-type transporter Mla MlaB component